METITINFDLYESKNCQVIEQPEESSGTIIKFVYSVESNINDILVFREKNNPLTIQINLLNDDGEKPFNYFFEENVVFEYIENNMLEGNEENFEPSTWNNELFESIINERLNSYSSDEEDDDDSPLTIEDIEKFLREDLHRKKNN